MSESSEHTGLLPVACPPQDCQTQLSSAGEPLLDIAHLVTSYGAVPPVPVKEHRKSSEVDRSVSPFRKEHHRDISRESGFETDYTRQSSVFSSLEDLHAETEDEELFGIMESRTSRVEEELEGLEQAMLPGGKDTGAMGELDLTVTILNINAEEDDFDNISVGTEYISVEDERKHYKSMFGMLYNVKQEIYKLSRYFELECARLDRLMVGENMSPAQYNQTTKLSEDYASRRDGFKDRLGACKDRVEKRMSEIRHRDNVIIDGVRYEIPESPIIREVRKVPISCANLCHMLLLLVLMAMIGYMYLWSKSSDEWKVYLRLVRSPILVVLLLYLYGINMKVWAYFKIDYANIFGHHPLTTPTPKYIFRCASILTIAMTICVITLIVSTPFEKKLPIKIIPLVMWLILIAFLLNPLNILERRIRYHFVMTIARVMVSPLIFVYFSDFYLADQFNSNVALFLDTQYLICYLTTDSWMGGKVDPGICTSSGNGIRPIISILPAFWRFVQCLRSYYDSRKVKYLVNAMKYFSAMPVVVLSTIYATKIKTKDNYNFADSFKLEETKVIFILWLVSLLVNGVYTFLWDIMCDWGVWEPKCTLFKRRLAYKSKPVYVLAMIFDMFFRFFWTLKLTVAIIWVVDSDLIFTGECVVCNHFKLFMAIVKIVSSNSLWPLSNSLV